MLELLESERAIVESRGHAEPVVHEGLFAGTVTMVHAAELRNSLVRFVHDQKIIRGDVIEQRWRSLAGEAAGEMARIIFYAVAVADGTHHFDIEHGALDDSLRLDDFPLAAELGLPPIELFIDALDGAFFLLRGQNVVSLGINGQARDFAFARANFTGERVNLADSFNLASPQLDAHGEIVVGRVDFDHVAAHAE